MPKHARPTSYTGSQSNQQKTGDTRAANLPEVVAGISEQLYISPSTLEYAIGNLLPHASETVAGIAEIATTAEVTTGTDDTRIVSPLKLAQRFASPPAIGSGTPAAGTFTAVTATTGAITATLGNIVASAGNISATLGSVTAGTSVTATLGNITATNGNIVRGTAGNKDVYTSVATTTTAGANSAGTVLLAGGTATISTTAVTASSQIRLYRQGIGATGAAALGIVTLGTIVAATSFVINAVQAADATALQASDVSVIAWEIVN